MVHEYACCYLALLNKQKLFRFPEREFVLNFERKSRQLFADG